MDIKINPVVNETEKNLTVACRIKNSINSLIWERISKIEEGGSVTNSWVDQMEVICKAKLDHDLPDVKLRSTLAREHLINYVIEERGSDFIK